MLTLFICQLTIEVVLVFFEPNKTLVSLIVSQVILTEFPYFVLAHPAQQILDQPVLVYKAVVNHLKHRAGVRTAFTGIEHRHFCILNHCYQCNIYRHNDRKYTDYNNGQHCCLYNYECKALRACSTQPFQWAC